MTDFNGGMDYGRNQQSQARTYYSYKIWNNNVKSPSATKTPGVVMIARTKVGEVYEKTQEIVDSVNMVLLFSSQARQLSTGMGKNFRTVCSSDDGVTPSLKVIQPLCNTLDGAALANVLSQWKGYDKAKIDAKIAELTQGGKLKVCGLKSQNGTIALCPYGRKDPVTGNKGACVPLIKLFGYDLDRKRTFTMELKGVSIEYFKDRIAPYHVFMKAIADKDLSCYDYSVKLAPKDVKGSFYCADFLLNEPLAGDLAAKMKEFAFKARDTYIKMSTPRDDKPRVEAQVVTTAPAKYIEVVAPPPAPIVEAENIDDVDF